MSNLALQTQEWDRYENVGYTAFPEIVVVKNFISLTMSDDET